MVNVKPAGDAGRPARQGTRPAAAPAGPVPLRAPIERVAPKPPGRTSFTAGINPAETLRKCVRDLETAAQGLAGEAATFVRSALDELGSALTALDDNGDVGSEAGDASLRADLQRTQEQHGDEPKDAGTPRAPAKRSTR